MWDLESKQFDSLENIWSVDQYEFPLADSLLKDVDRWEETWTIKEATQWMNNDRTNFKWLYPDLVAILENSKSREEYEQNLWFIISAIVLNMWSVRSYLQSVIAWKPTWDIEYHLNFVKDLLEEVKGTSLYKDNPIYQDFYSKESDALRRLELYAKHVISGKKRNSNGVYE